MLREYVGGSVDVGVVTKGEIEKMRSTERQRFLS
jgi:hypothetical protein